MSKVTIIIPVYNSAEYIGKWKMYRKYFKSNIS